MRPAYSVVFLTTLIGAGQGLFLALYGAEVFAALGVALVVSDVRYFVRGAAIALGLAGLGLFASFFHLGRPERAWRSAAMWRTSWLSREVIALPLFMTLAAAWGAAHHFGWGGTIAIGALAFAACMALFLCTAMIYACIKFLQEWASPFTLPNFFLMGCASGFTLATALSTAYAPSLTWGNALAAIVFTVAAFGSRVASLVRNSKIRHRSTTQTAIGSKSAQVRQISQGFTGESFNTQEFFHGRSANTLRLVRTTFLLLGFVAPVALIGGGIATRSPMMLAAAFALQYAGLALERWYFLADAQHPQNLYYQNRA
jgi:DMSO reductase anchor subunit